MSTHPVALITGAAHRIGKALSIALHKQNYNIAIHCHHSIKDSETLAAQLNKIRKNSAKVFQANLISSEEIKRCHQQVMSWHSQINVLINNASLFLDDSIAFDNWDELFKCNIKAPYYLSQLCYQSLKESNGCIINLTDIHAKSPLKNYGVYCMTKAALESQTQSLAKDFSPHIRVNAIAPGAILWPENSSEIDDDTKQKIISKTPLKMPGGTKPICQAALHFIENKFITGTSLNVDGGRFI